MNDIVLRLMIELYLTSVALYEMEFRVSDTVKIKLELQTIKLLFSLLYM